MIIGYCRVSSIGQADNNSLEAQTKQLQEYGCEQIITEVYTGKTMARPKFQELFQQLQSGDTLVVCKLDRFARTVIEGIQAIQELFNRGVKCHILNMGLIEDSLTGHLILNILLAFSEYERSLIAERCAQGRAIARQNPDYKEGRPKKFTKAQITHALDLLDSGKSYRQVEEMTRISKSTLVRAKRKSTISS